MSANVARMGDMRNANTILVGKSKGKSHLEDLDVDGIIILKFRKV
jgi:hypothetical protein